ncbi:hypothetical protein [Pseudophaeobacter flagellatus]|uniref:hypothetical protein n=1 Tax=Pseudophaeobacter flagellatus TaxID=2899119 RepID=UPI001E3B621D|nr:hypothetical protein [Pseudophaeobacter flagellatus]MCD9146198.1 hypothetical protein [Pseudophaeobacter flagellatus]
MPNSVLYVRNSGFGDMLRQINVFFHLADIYSFNPTICFPRNNNRNSLGNATLFKEVGFADITAHGPGLPREQVGSLADISSRVEGAYRFDARCYNSSDFARVLGERAQERHPKLRALALQSSLYAEIAKRQEGNKNRIVVHVRRGDVAQVCLREFTDIFDENSVAGKVLHCRGLFDAASLREDLPYSNRRRFASVPSYLQALNLAKEQQGAGSHVLISDGFSKIARVVGEQHADLLVDGSLSVGALEKAFENELRPLMLGASREIIGESSAAFLDVIYAALTARVIVSQSPGFLKELARLFELDIEFVYPEFQPRM